MLAAMSSVVDLGMSAVGSPQPTALEKKCELLMNELNAFGAELRLDAKLRERMREAIIQFDLQDAAASSSAEPARATCVLFLAGERCDYAYDVHAGAVRPPFEADCTVALNADDVEPFLDGRMNLIAAYLSGALRVGGDRRCALDLLSLIHI